MKRGIIYIVIGIFFVLVSKYLIDNFSPFNFTAIQGVIDSNKIKLGDWNAMQQAIAGLVARGEIIKYLSVNAYFVLIAVLVSIFCFFVPIHLVIDKLFFKNFYEEPSMFDAVRRGFLFCLGLAFVLYLKLLSVELYFLILVPVLLILLEAFFTAYIKHHIVKHVTNVKEFHKEFKQKQNKEKIKAQVQNKAEGLGLRK